MLGFGGGCVVWSGSWVAVGACGVRVSGCWVWLVAFGWVLLGCAGSGWGVQGEGPGRLRMCLRAVVKVWAQGQFAGMRSLWR